MVATAFWTRRRVSIPCVGWSIAGSDCSGFSTKRGNCTCGCSSARTWLKLDIAAWMRRWHDCAGAARGERWMGMRGTTKEEDTREFSRQGLYCTDDETTAVLPRPLASTV